MSRDAVLTRQYETTIDRVGLAIALLVGAILTALGITALAAFPWLLLHATGKRGPVSAALLGAAIGFLLFLGGQTWGFGLFTMPAMDIRTAFMRWVSGIATSLVMAAMAAAVAVVMWRVAYRRVR